MIIVVMGVSGAGKSTIGRKLADALRTKFLDADTLHPAENVTKMASGMPLTDEDRWPWLDAVRARMEEALARDETLVVACSALKASYRQYLSQSIPNVCFVFLHAPRDVLRERLLQRRDHFFTNPDLLDSQLATLEPPEDALSVDVSGRTVDETVAAIARDLVR